MNPILKKVYKDIANKHGLTIEEVEQVVKHQFGFVREVMAKGEKNNPDTFKTIQLTHLGKFAVREYKLKEFQKKANGKK
jgi:nucleoid DNA-binding protein